MAAETEKPRHWGDYHGDDSGNATAAITAISSSAEEGGDGAAPIYIGAAVTSATVRRDDGETKRAQQEEGQEEETPPCSPASMGSFSSGVVMATTQVMREASEGRGRRSSAGSCSDDSDAHGDAGAAVHQLPAAAQLQISTAKTDGASSSADVMSPVKKAGSRAEILKPPVDVVKRDVSLKPERMPSALASPHSPRTFEQVVSPRSLANGKRFLSGYLLRRVPMAGRLLKTWKRQFFRLRDHGVVCYKDEASGSSAPLFEICFTAHSMVQADRFRGGNAASGAKTKASTAAAGDAYSYIPEDQSSSIAANNSAVSGRKQSTESLAFILKHVEIVAGQQQGKVDVPMFLRAENEQEFGDWLHCLRLKMDARKHALAAEAAAHATGADGTVTAEDVGAAHKTAPKANSREEDDRLNDMKSPTSTPTSGSKNGSPKSSLLSSIKRSLSFGRQDNLLFGVSPDDPPEFAQFHQRYMLMREIGEGSFSIVHKAVNRLTGRLCAVKCCKYSSALVEEVRIMRKLNHPNLVKVEGVFKHEDMHYVVMDYMEDGDLCDMLIQKQRLPEKDARRIIAQVLQGLEHLHANCVLHRDIKPENILLHGDVVKIADFGLAKQLAEPDATVNRSCGTLEYAAPELISGREYGLKSDVFSLGVVMYVLLFGAFPFSVESATALQCMKKFPRGVDIRDMSCLSPDNYQWRSVSPEAQDAILRMLAPEPEDRISAVKLLQHPWFDVLTARDAPPLSRKASNLARNSSTASLGGIRAMLDLQPSSREFSQQVNAPTDRQGIDEEQVQQLTPWQMRERTSAGHEIERVADCDRQGFRELLFRGLEVTKFGFKGATSPHMSIMRLDFVNRCISWTGRQSVINNLGGSSSRSVLSASAASSSQAQTTGKKRSTQRSILLVEVLEIRVGHNTEAFQHAQLKAKPALMPPLAALCLSIVSARRTLDVAVKTPSQRAFLERGLRELLAAIQPQPVGAASKTGA